MSLDSDAAKDNFIFSLNNIYCFFLYLLNYSQIDKNALVRSRSCAKQTLIWLSYLTPQQHSNLPLTIHTLPSAVPQA